MLGPALDNKLCLEWHKIKICLDLRWKKSYASGGVRQKLCVQLY